MVTKPMGVCFSCLLYVIAAGLMYLHSRWHYDSYLDSGSILLSVRSKPQCHPPGQKALFSLLLTLVVEEKLRVKMPFSDDLKMD